MESTPDKGKEGINKSWNAKSKLFATPNGLFVGYKTRNKPEMKFLEVVGVWNKRLTFVLRT